MNRRKLPCNTLHFKVTRSETVKGKEKQEEHSRQRGKLESSCRGGKAQDAEGRVSNSFNFTLEFSTSALRNISSLQTPHKLVRNYYTQLGECEYNIAILIKIRKEITKKLLGLRRLSIISTDLETLLYIYNNIYIIYI